MNDNQQGEGHAWTVVVPVKPSRVGKSRLEVPGVDRDALAHAIALDTVAAAARVAHVIVVTDDPEVADGARGTGADVVPDADAGGLDAAIAAGIAAAPPERDRAALLGDLPALRSEELAATLAAAAAVDRAVVADAEGTGSTLVTARAGVPWSSAFGDGSFARHVALGCVPVEARDAPSVHRDVDTAAQLDDARALGLGPRTAALLRAARRGASAPDASGRVRLREMTDDDLDDMSGLLGDPAVMTYYPRIRTREEVADWIEWSRRNYRRHGFGLWIVETADGEFLGDCGLTWQPVAGGRRLEVGYHIRPEAQGRGYATEAAAACRDFARGLGFTELVAVIHPDNAASLKVAEKLGMTRERSDIHPSGRPVTIMRMPL